LEVLAQFPAFLNPMLHAIKKRIVDTGDEAKNIPITAMEPNLM
jgi:hypothetical protein